MQPGYVHSMIASTWQPNGLSVTPRGRFGSGLPPVGASAQASLGGKSAAQTGALSDTSAVAKQREEAAAAEARRQAKALKFQQMMQAKFGKEVENQLEADDDQDAAAVNTSTYFADRQAEAHFADKKAPPPSGGYAKTTETNFKYGFHGTHQAVRLE